MHRDGHQVAVVVSAMAGETNRLTKLAETLSTQPQPRELDVLLSSGETVSIALLAIALNEIGVKARSFSGPQAGIQTDGVHTKARITALDAAQVDTALAAGEVAVVAGFQGYDAQANITTLGRGGSDLTAVALAAALDADTCEIYTDVDGIYTTDPGIVRQARKLRRVSYEEMLELASLGAKVLQSRSVELAMKTDVALHVRSAFDDRPGTWVTKEVPEMEAVVVRGIAHQTDEAKISLRQVPDQPGIAAKVFTPLAEAEINVDMIIQNASADGATDLTFTVAGRDLAAAKRILEQQRDTIGWRQLVADDAIAKVSIVGVGMRSHAGVAAKAFEALSACGINIQMIATSEIKISLLIDRKFTELAVRELHRLFELESDAD